MAKLGITPKDLPGYHLSEQRRLVEGQLVENELKEAAREAGGDSEDYEQALEKQGRKRRAARRFKQSRTNSPQPTRGRR